MIEHIQRKARPTRMTAETANDLEVIYYYESDRFGYFCRYHV